MTPRWHDSDAAPRYVAGTLPPEELDAFEEHLLSCDECRHEVRLGAAVRSSLVAPTTRVSATRRRGLFAAVAVSAAAGIALIVIAEASRSRLGAVDAPPFAGGAARSSGDTVAALVDRGMTAYAAGDFAEAAEMLAAAATRDSTPGVAFYLGVALLKGDNARDALAALERARRPDGNPFADEATLFAAKALVRLRHADSAVILLDRAAASSVAPASLRAFADSIRGR